MAVAPPFALIVKNAAGVEREIAADRPHVAVGRAGDMAGRLRHHRIVLQHTGMRGEFGECDRGTDLESARVRLDGAQLGDAVDVDRAPAGRRCRA